MEKLKKEWTHKNVELTDIRKINKLYIISTKEFNPLFVNEKIFEDRLRSYFLMDYTSSINNISREQIMKLKWNMYITKGKFIKIDKEGNIQEFEQNPDKHYVSYLEVSGDLGNFLMNND